MIEALIANRRYIWRNALREVRHRYAGSVLGVAWNVLQPLAMIAIFSIVFGSIMTSRGAGLGELPGGYALYLCAALVPWLGFSECLSRGTTTLTAHAPALRKLAMHEAVFVAQTVVSTMLGLVVAQVLVLIYALVAGAHPTWAWIVLPAPLALLLLAALGLSLALATLHAYIRDVAQLVQIILRVWFWTVPIVWRVEQAPAWFASAVHYNPLHPYLASMRDIIVWGRWPGADSWLLMALWSTAALALGAVVMSRLRGELRDVL